MTQQNNFSDKMAEVFAASSLAYSISCHRLEHNLPTYQETKSFTHSEVKEKQIVDFLTEKEMFFPIVTNAAGLNTSYGFIKTVDNIVEIGLSVSIGKTTTTIEASGSKQEIEYIMEKFSNEFPNDTFEVIMVDSIGDNGSVNQRKVTIDLKNVNTQTKEFFPWMEKDMETLYEEYFNSNKAVLIFIGAPGCGKSTSCRNMLKHFGETTMLANNESLFKDSRLFEHFASSDAKLLLIEDADNAVMARSDGNVGMSYLLSLTDGIIPLNKKIVIVTNLSSVNKIDSAILRPGRCYDVIEFKLLSVQEAMDARASIGKPYIDLEGVQKEWTLAEALNYDDKIRMEKRKKVAIGFGNQ